MEFAQQLGMGVLQHVADKRIFLNGNFFHRYPTLPALSKAETLTRFAEAILPLYPVLVFLPSTG